MSTGHIIDIAYNVDDTVKLVLSFKLSCHVFIK